jgi:hypothetical protein
MDVDGFKLPLSHVEPDCVVLRTKASLPPQHAEVIVSVDGREQRRRVFLPDGITADEPIVRIVGAPATNVA